MREEEAGTALGIGLDAESEACGGNEVEDETHHVTHRHRHRGPQMSITFRGGGRDQLDQSVVDAILDEGRQAAHDAEADDFTELALHQV